MREHILWLYPIFLSLRNIIIDQFERIRDGDRFWFENRGNGIFSEEEVAAIRNISIWDIIVNATSIRPDEIQRKVGRDLRRKVDCDLRRKVDHDLRRKVDRDPRRKVDRD